MVAGKRTHRRDRVARRFVLVLIGLAVLALFAPAIVATTGMQQWALDRAVPPSVGKLTARGVSLGWWSPVELSGVQLTDLAGTVVFQAGTLRMDRTLTQLLSNSKDLGKIQLDRPMFAVFVRGDGSNVEDLIALLEQEAALEQDRSGQTAGESPSPPLQIEITNGAVQIVEAVGKQRSWVIDEVNAQIDTTPAIPSIAASAIVYEGVIDTAAAPVRQAGQVAPARNSGNLQIENTSSEQGQRVSLTLERFALDPLEPWLARIDPTLELTGQASGSGVAEWRPAASAPAGDRAAGILAAGVVTSGTVAINGFGLKSQSLGERPLALETMKLPWRVRTTSSGALAVEQLNLTSELGETKLRGELNYQELTRLLAGEWSAPATFMTEADLDLAQLARVAPGVVRLRPGTAIQAGRARVTLGSRPIDPTRPEVGCRLSGTADTSDLTAVANGRVIEWNRPVVLRTTATQNAAGLRVDELICQSEFLDVTANGNAAGAKADLRFDLDRLTQQLGRFVDLTGWRLAGRGAANVTLQRPSEQQFTATTSVNLTDVIVATPERTLLNERRLVGELTAAGVNDASFRPTRLESANCSINAGADTLTARTTGPIGADGSTPMTMQLKGQLTNWLARLRLVAPEAAASIERLAGAAEVSATGVVARDRFAFSSFKAAATEFELNTGDLRIREPRVEASGSLAYDPAGQRLASDKLQLVTSSASALGRNLNLAWGPTGGAPSSGRLAVRADLGRLSRWFASLQRADAIRPAGGVTGDVSLTDQNGRIVAALNLKGQQLSLQQASGAAPSVLWQSPTMTLQGQATYAPNIDQLTFRDLSVDSPTLRGSATGQVNRVAADAELQINGVVDYDLEQWATVIAAKLGRGFRVVGKDQATFQVSGLLKNPPPSEGVRGRSATSATSHWSQRLTGRVEAPWSSAVAYGVPIGPGRLGLALSQGVVRADPLVVALGSAAPGGEVGRLTLQPAVQLDPPPALVGLPAGPVLTNVRITPEISAEMLKYFAPVLQGATQSEGVFSLTSNGARAPLADMTQADVSGQLVVQSVRVVPGPMTAQWVAIAQQVEAIAAGGDPTALLNRQPTTLLSVDDRSVEYRVAGGRVYHQPMAFRVGNVLMQSSGSVGFDETLDLTLTVPIQDRWVEGRPLLVGLRGQSVQVPVRGTFKQPRIDNRAVRDLSKQLARDAVGGALGNEIGRALEKLFD